MDDKSVSSPDEDVNGACAAPPTAEVTRRSSLRGSNRPLVSPDSHVRFIDQVETHQYQSEKDELGVNALVDDVFNMPIGQTRATSSLRSKSAQLTSRAANVPKNSQSDDLQNLDPDSIDWSAVEGCDGINLEGETGDAFEDYSREDVQLGGFTVSEIIDGLMNSIGWSVGQTPAQMGSATEESLPDSQLNVVNQEDDLPAHMKLADCNNYVEDYNSVEDKMMDQISFSKDNQVDDELKVQDFLRSSVASKSSRGRSSAPAMTPSFREQLRHSTVNEEKANLGSRSTPHVTPESRLDQDKGKFESNEDQGRPDIGISKDLVSFLSSLWESAHAMHYDTLANKPVQLSSGPGSGPMKVPGLSMSGNELKKQYSPVSVPGLPFTSAPCGKGCKNCMKPKSQHVDSGMAASDAGGNVPHPPRTQYCRPNCECNQRNVCPPQYSHCQSSMVGAEFEEDSHASTVVYFPHQFPSDSITSEEKFNQKNKQNIAAVPGMVLSMSLGRCASRKCDPDCKCGKASVLSMDDSCHSSVGAEFEEDAAVHGQIITELNEHDSSTHTSRNQHENESVAIPVTSSEMEEDAGKTKPMLRERLDSKLYHARNLMRRQLGCQSRPEVHFQMVDSNTKPSDYVNADHETTLPVGNGMEQSVYPELQSQGIQFHKEAADLLHHHGSSLKQNQERTMLNSDLQQKNQELQDRSEILIDQIHARNRQLNQAVLEKGKYNEEYEKCYEMRAKEEKLIAGLRNEILDLKRSLNTLEHERIIYKTEQDRNCQMCSLKNEEIKRLQDAEKKKDHNNAKIVSDLQAEVKTANDKLIISQDRETSRKKLESENSLLKDTVAALVVRIDSIKSITSGLEESTNEHADVSNLKQEREVSEAKYVKTLSALKSSELSLSAANDSREQLRASLIQTDNTIKFLRSQLKREVDNGREMDIKMQKMLYDVKEKTLCIDEMNAKTEVMSKVQNELEDEKKQSHNLSLDLQKAMNEKRTLETEFNGLKVEHRAACMDKDHLKAETLRLTNNLKLITDRNDNLLTKLRMHQSEVLYQTAELKHSKAEIENLRKESEARCKEIRAEKMNDVSDIAAVNRQANEQSSQLLALTSDNHMLQSQLNVAEQNCRDFISRELCVCADKLVLEREVLKQRVKTLMTLNAALEGKIAEDKANQGQELKKAKDVIADLEEKLHKASLKFTEADTNSKNSEKMQRSQESRVPKTADDALVKDSRQFSESSNLVDRTIFEMEKAMHRITKLHLTGIRDQNDLLRTRLLEFTKQSAMVDKPAEKSRMDRINEIIALSQSKAKKIANSSQGAMYSMVAYNNSDNNVQNFPSADFRTCLN